MTELQNKLPHQVVVLTELKTGYLITYDPAYYNLMATWNKLYRFWLSCIVVLLVRKGGSLSYCLQVGSLLQHF